MKIVTFLFFIFLIGCKDEPVRDTTYIHGEIVNPFENYILLYKDNDLVDTIFLNDRNTFTYELKEAEEGLYIFRQPPESQTIYIVPGDSILFRVNTLAFDETLYFSGTSAVKNNFLMELFLLNDRNNELILSYYKIDPKKFAAISDSIHTVRENMFDELVKENDFSENFIELGAKSVDYEFYDLRERYAFLIQKFAQDERKISERFFDYRNQVNFNDKTLKNHIVYQRFLDDYLKNRSIENCEQRSTDRDCYSLNNYYNLRRRILLVDSLFTIDVLRNRFFQRFGAQQIIFSDRASQIDSTLQLLSKLSYEEKGLEELGKLADVQRSYFIGNNISDKKLIDFEGHKISIKKLLNKPTITFSWSLYNEDDYKNKHEKISELRRKYPEINFIAINIDDGETEAWKRVVTKNRYDPNFEYQNRGTGDKKELYRNYLNKVLFINRKGEIVFGDIPLDSPNFEGYILEFLNQ
ncbi:MAG TPA: hypothetical protein VFM82_03145 [Flavobacteriaceae bacterium]|nr:hypothetical protein [Flavobacteriaceae bacterium]